MIAPAYEAAARELEPQVRLPSVALGSDRDTQD